MDTQKSTVDRIKELVATAARFRNAYFWAPPVRPSDRRLFEESNSIPLIEWDDGQVHYTGRYIVSCNPRNICALGVYTRDGKATNLTAVKNSLKRLEAQLDQANSAMGEGEQTSPPPRNGDTAQ